MLQEFITQRFVSAVRAAWEGCGRGALLVALSGGADSTALLLACHITGIPIEAAHCNFNLRGEESIRDREFVRKLCDQLGVELNLAEFSTMKLCRKGESVEMTCRRLRYDFFEQIRKEHFLSRVAVAHNADDNIETFFINALRGSGTRGLKGMEKDSGIILRPFLDFSRQEILKFLEENGQDYIVDSTNLESDYRRNFLRNEIFPLLESKWEGFRKAIGNTISLQERENRIVENCVKKAIKPGFNFLSWSVVKEFPDPVTLIYRFISQFGGSSIIAEEMFQSMSEVVPGKKWHLKDVYWSVFTKTGISIIQDVVTKERDLKTLYTWHEISPENIDLSALKKLPLTEVCLPHGEDFYEWKLADEEMVIRPLGIKGSQKVWKVLKDGGITAMERGRYPVLVEKAGGEPIWIPGLKRSRRHLIKDARHPIFHVTPAF